MNYIIIMLLLKLFILIMQWYENKSKLFTFWNLNGVKCKNKYLKNI